MKTHSTRRYYGQTLLVALAALVLPNLSLAAFDAEEEDYYRRAIANGLTPQAAASWVKGPEGQGYVRNQRAWNQAIACYGGAWSVPSDVKERIAAGTKSDVPFDGKWTGRDVTFKCPIKQ